MDNVKNAWTLSSKEVPLQCTALPDIDLLHQVLLIDNIFKGTVLEKNKFSQ